MKNLRIKKLYYSIGEVSKIVEEEQYVLRYWETEFEQLRPQKNRSGNRSYTERDIAIIRAIKILLREKRYTVDGAKELMTHFDPETGRFIGVEIDVQPESVASDTPTDQHGEDIVPMAKGDLLLIKQILVDLLRLLETSKT